MFPSVVFPRCLGVFACVAGFALPVAAASDGHLIDSAAPGSPGLASDPVFTALASLPGRRTP